MFESLHKLGSPLVLAKFIPNCRDRHTTKNNSLLLSVRTGSMSFVHQNGDCRCQAKYAYLQTKNFRDSFIL